MTFGAMYRSPPGPVLTASLVLPLGPPSCSGTAHTKAICTMLGPLNRVVTLMSVPGSGFRGLKYPSTAAR